MNLNIHQVQKKATISKMDQWMTIIQSTDLLMLSIKIYTKLLKMPEINSTPNIYIKIIKNTKNFNKQPNDFYKNRKQKFIKHMY